MLPTEKYLAKKKKTKMSLFKGRTVLSFNKCYYCGEEGTEEAQLTKDHFYPESKGGRLKVQACYSCNQEKKDMTPEEWISYLQQKLAKVEDKFVNYNERIRLRRMVRKSQQLWDKTKWSLILKHEKMIPKKEIESFLQVFNHEYRGKDWTPEQFMIGLDNWLKPKLVPGNYPVALTDPNYLLAFNAYGDNNTIESVKGTTVILSKLKDNQSVICGDGKNYHFILTKK